MIGRGLEFKGIVEFRTSAPDVPAHICRPPAHHLPPQLSFLLVLLPPLPSSLLPVRHPFPSLPSVTAVWLRVQDHKKGVSGFRCMCPLNCYASVVCDASVGALRPQRCRPVGELMNSNPPA